jgi:hypothetical protein
MNVKLAALKGGASREGLSFHIVPLPPALKGGFTGHLPANNESDHWVLKLDIDE